MLAAGVAGAVAFWQLGPLADANAADLARAAEPIRSGPAGPLLGALVVAVASFAFVPVLLLIPACALLWGPWIGAAVAFAGSVASAAAGYAAGRVLWREALHRRMSARVERISLHLAHRGVLAVALVRLVPLAPFAAVNLAAGASHLRLRDYLLGTALALAPGILATTALADRLRRFVAAPDLPGALGLAAGIAVLVGAGAWLRRRLAAAPGPA